MGDYGGGRPQADKVTVDVRAPAFQGYGLRDVNGHRKKAGGGGGLGAGAQRAMACHQRAAGAGCNPGKGQGAWVAARYSTVVAVLLKGSSTDGGEAPRLPNPSLDGCRMGRPPSAGVGVLHIRTCMAMDGGVRAGLGNVTGRCAAGAHECACMHTRFVHADMHSVRLPNKTCCACMRACRCCTWHGIATAVAWLAVSLRRWGTCGGWRRCSGPGGCVPVAASPLEAWHVMSES